MTPLSPEDLAAKLATIEAEQSAGAKSLELIAAEQVRQGRNLERVAVILENIERDRADQSARFGSHSARLRELEKNQARLNDLPVEVDSLKETVGKRAFMASFFGALATSLVLLGKFLFTGGGK